MTVDSFYLQTKRGGREKEREKRSQRQHLTRKKKDHQVLNKKKKNKGLEIFGRKGGKVFFLPVILHVRNLRQ